MGFRRVSARASGAAVLAAALSLARVASPEGPQPSQPSPVASPASSPVAQSASPLAGPIQAAVRALVNERAFKDAVISLEVADVDTGQILASFHEHAAVNPASNAKLYTAAVALATLHGDHRFETALLGTIKGGTVTGNLVLRGHGDPSLTTADLFELVQDLKGAGVRQVAGDVMVDQRFFDEETTPPGFEQQPGEWAAFRAPVSALALNENTITLTVRATEPGQPAIARFDPPGFVDVEGDVKTSDGGADTVGLELTGSGRRMHAKLSGLVSRDSRVVRYTRRVEDPTLLAGYALRALLEEAQIKVVGDVKPAAGREGTVIARHESAPLSALLYALGKQSDNFYAEMVFKSLGGEAKGRPARSAGGAEIVERWAARVGALDTGLVVKNGSGLFDSNRTTAASVVGLLRAAWRDPVIQPEFVAQLAVGGVDGTLKHRFRGGHARRLVRAKTGTLEDAAALSGYVSSPSGRGTVAFSILFNHVAGKVAAARAAADALVETVARNLTADSR
jgi:D-alanyl-D-alanine carboxypeptidase/D-alanyl-D-alanine-endopeptidase (penicillin-binding protein 4)